MPGAEGGQQQQQQQQQEGWALPAGAPPGKGGKKGGGKAPGSGPPKGPPKQTTLEEATTIFREVVKLRDKDSKAPCLRMQIWGKCAIPNCKYSHAKGQDGRGLAIILTNHQKRCCRTVVDAQAKAKAKGGAPPTKKAGKADPKDNKRKPSVPPPNKKPNAHGMPWG